MSAIEILYLILGFMVGIVFSIITIVLVIKKLISVGVRLGKDE